MTSTIQPLGTSGDQRRRLRWHHVPFALASAMVMTLPLFQAAHHARDGHDHAERDDSAARAAGHHGPHQEGRHHGGDGRQDRMFMARITTATGYVAHGLLAFTLLIGPANLLLRRRNPVSNYLRRDAGAWTAMVTVVHVIVGLQAHGPPAPASLGEGILRYFFGPDGGPLTNSFGLGNWTGLAATVIAVGLLAISSDFALRKLKAGPWKWLQRLNYALFVLVIAHAIFYGALLRVTSPSTLLLGLSVIAVFVAQAVGVWLWRRRGRAYG